MDFDSLIEFLDSDRNEFGLSSLATHGFLTASVVGKPLANWQSLLFEGHEKQVSPDVLATLAEWRDSLQDELQQERAIELPFSSEDTDFDDIENSEVAEWSVGFVDAMYASDDEEDDWFGDEDSEEDVAMLTLPMILFSGIDEDQADIQDLLKDRTTLSQMVDAMEKNLVELYLLFHTND